MQRQVLQGLMCQSTGAFQRISCVFYVMVNLDPEVDSRFAWKSRFPRAPSLPAVLMRPVYEDFWKNLILLREGGLVQRSILRSEMAAFFGLLQVFWSWANTHNKHNNTTTSNNITLVGDLAVQARSQPEPCAVRCDEHYFLVWGRVCV